MANCTVLLPKSVDLAQIKYSQPKTLSNGSRTVYITYAGNRLAIQTPIMRFPYGVGEGYDADKEKEKKDSDSKRYDIHVSFIGHDENAKVKQMLDLMLALETKLKADTFKHRVEWLGDDYDGLETVVGKLFTPIVKYDKDKVTKKIVGKYPPTMKLKIPHDPKTDTFQFTAKDMDGNIIDFKAVMRNLRGGRGKMVIQLGGLWFAGGKYGCTWKIVNTMLDENIQSIPEFVPDSDDEDERKPPTTMSDDADLLADAMDNSKLAEGGGTSTVDSDEAGGEEAGDGEDGDSDIEEPPPPPPPPAKKTTRKPSAR